MSENVSRRKMLSLLGLGATLGFAAAGVLEPLVAHAQEAAPAFPTPRRPTPAALSLLEPRGRAGGRGEGPSQQAAHRSP